MYYQIVVREGKDQWEPFDVPTASWTELLDILGQAQKHHPSEDITILHSSSLAELDDLVEACRYRCIEGGVLLGAPAVISTTTIPDETLDRRRWAAETGPGGDHDAPYEFALPSSQPALTKWLRLLSKVRSGDLEP